MNKIYLASPYSHPDPAMREKRFRAACMATAELMLDGHVAYSPIAHSHPVATIGGIDPMHNFDWLGQDLPVLAKFDEVHVLCIPGAAESKGVKVEIQEAKRLGKHITHMLPSARIKKLLGIESLAVDALLGTLEIK